MASALLKYLDSKALWQQASANGIERVRALLVAEPRQRLCCEYPRPCGQVYPLESAPPRTRTLRYRDRSVVTDLDQSLIGDDAALARLLAVLRENRKDVSFTIATGRRVDSALALMKKHGIPTPTYSLPAWARASSTARR